MKSISPRRYSIVETTLLILRAGSMLLSLVLVWQAFSGEGLPADELTSVMLRALYPLIFGIAIGLWQDRWENRHVKRKV